MGSGPIVIGYDGSPAAEHAVREAGALLPGRPALAVVVWKQGLGFEALETPTATGFPPVEIDIRTAVDMDREMSDRAQRLAQQGARLARDAGFEAQGLAIAEDVDMAVADALLRVAGERDAQAIVIGPHGHGRIGEMLPGRTSREVIREAPCPVLVVRPPEG
jgi:nucleotide-binding universal stress UspA family protein